MNTEASTATPALSLDGFLRLEQIIGNPEKGIPALIPVSKATWHRGVAAGRYPVPVKLSERTRAWWGPDIRKLIEAQRNAAQAA